MSQKALIFAVLAAVLICSGCVNTSVFSGDRPEDLVKTYPEAQNFLEAYPDADLHATLNSEGYIRSVISEITDKCGSFFKITDYWKVELQDSVSGDLLTVWIEKDSGQLACLYGEGVDSPAPVIPKQAQDELTISGFSDIEVSKGLTKFENRELILNLKNPNPERITIKRVRASYLDDVITNTTNSGFLNQGESQEYTFDFSRTIDEAVFWIEVEVLYDRHDFGETNQKSRGSVISGMDINRILTCSKASFEVDSFNFYVGTRILNINLENTGDIELNLNPYYRDQNQDLIEAGDEIQIGVGEQKSLELTGLTRIMEDVLLVSDACLGTSEVIFVDEIPGV